MSAVIVEILFIAVLLAANGVFAMSEIAVVSEDEVRVMIEQATNAGVFEPAEREMVESIFGLGDRRVTALTTPRVDVAWLDVNLPTGEIARQISASHYSRLPVCDRHPDNVLGVVKAKDLLPGEEDGAYQTLAGFVITHLGRIPSAADRFEWGGLTIEVVDMDGRRVRVRK